MKYDFDKLIERRGTDSVKYDLLAPLFGRDDLIPMWVADMDFEVPDFIRKALADRLEHPIYGYTLRSSRFYEAIAGWMERRHGWHTDPKSIDFSPGIVPALNLCVLGYTEPGDKILVQPPVYFPFFTAVERHQRELVYNQLLEEGGIYTMDFDDLEKKFKEGVKMMMFCHPHNPVGRAWNREELSSLANLCVKYGVKVISDEIHSDLLLFNHKHIPLASLGKEISDLCVTCVAPSKTFNLAGMHSSAVIIESPEMKAVYGKVLEDVHVGGGNLFGMVAMEAAYLSGDEWLEQLLRYLEDNFTFLKEFTESHIPDITISPLEATYLVWLGFEKLGMDDTDLTKFIINEAKLGLLDGPRFGPGGESYQRINIATPRVILEKGLNQLSDAINNSK
jgi:cysteine-S-conjugate beta-lyase